MADLKRIGAIDISEDMRHERREWMVQRVGWAAMAGFLVAAALGLFGSGPLARTSAGEGDLRVHYPMFLRAESPVGMRVEATPGPGELRVWIGREYLEDNEIERITPEPDSIEIEPDRVVHVFKATGEGGRRAVHFDVRARSPGVQSLRLGTDRGHIDVEQMVYP